MLAYTLSVTAGLASLFFYLSAFFFPRLHRKDDFFWSALGLFYSLSLWIGVEKITGGILLGQLCILILVLSFGWQNFRLRNKVFNLEVQTNFAEFSFLDWIENFLKRQSFPPSTTLYSKDKKTNSDGHKKELKLQKKNTIENENINISKKKQINKLLDKEKISNIKKQNFSFESLFSFTKLGPKINPKLSENDTGKELLDTSNMFSGPSKKVENSKNQISENKKNVINNGDKDLID